MSRVTWSEDQKTLLRERFKTTCDADLAQLVGLPQVKVYHQLRRMKLVRVALAYNDKELLALYRSTAAQGTSNFPARFFTGDVGLERLSRLVRVVLTEVAEIAIDDVPHRLSADLLGELGLAAPLAKHVGQSPYKSANLAWPGRWKPWEFGAVPNGYWSGRNGKEHAKAAIHWLVEMRLGLQPEELPTMQLDALFNTNGLGGALVAFGGSAIAAIVYAYPQFRAHDFKGARYDAERRAHIVQRIKDMFEGMPPDEIPKNASKKLFREHGLLNDLTKLFGGSPWAALEAAFPGRYEKWQVSDARHIWSGEERIENVTSAVRWLVETKLGLEPSTAPQELRQDHFVDAGLAGMLNGCPELSKSYVQAFQLAYPGVAHIWEFRYPPRGTFRGAQGRETAVEAVRWMVAKLGVEPAALSGLITREHFANAGLLNMLDPVFGGSPAKACLAAYPDVFKPWDFPNRRGLWKGQKGKELATQATRWLIEEQLQLSPDEVPEHIRTSHFRAAGLGSLLANCPAVRGSIFHACKLVYPEAGYRRAAFKGLRIEVELGLALERITQSLYDLEGEATFRFNKTADHCTHKRRCKPDFMLCDNGEWDREWVDCKLHWYTFYNGEAKRYLDHCGKLTIIHLDPADDVFETDRVAFVPVRERFAHLRQRAGAAELFADLDKLSAGVLPERFRERAGGVMSEQLSWSLLDLDHLRKRASDYTAAELGRQLGKSRSAVYNQAKRMKLAIKPDGFWNAQRDDFVRDSYENMNSPTIARELGEPCTREMVAQRLIKLGLKRTKTWTAEKHQFLEENFHTMTNAELATELKVTPRAISVRLSKHKLRR